LHIVKSAIIANKKKHQKLLHFATMKTDWCACKKVYRV